MSKQWKVTDGKRVIGRYQWRSSAVSWALAKVRHRSEPLYVMYTTIRDEVGRIRVCTDVIHPNGRIETKTDELQFLHEIGVHVW